MGLGSVELHKEARHLECMRVHFSNELLRGWSIRMSATASLMRPDVAAWSTYQPVALRPKGADARSTSVTAGYDMPLNDGANAQSADGVSNGADEIDAFFAFLIEQQEQSMRELASSLGDDSDGPGLDVGMMTSLLFSAISGNAQNGEGGNTGTGAGGEVCTASGGNPAAIAHGVLGQSAASIMSSQQLPMHQGVPTNVCCANFVSACLTKAGLLPASEHTDNVSTLKSTLQKRGWHRVSRAEAKPGDVCIIGDDEHVELVSENDKGNVKLIGSNNEGEEQFVSEDGASGNRGDAQIWSRA